MEKSHIVLELQGKISKELQDKHWKQFEKQAGYRGNGIYEWRNNFSTDTRELLLMGIADVEEIKYNKV